MSGKQEATYHGADVVTRLRLYGPESDYNGIMGEAADEIERLREGFAELAAVAKEWDEESGRAELYSRADGKPDVQKRLAIQRAMLLHHHAAAVEGCIDRAKP